jgi:GT2 family glycosyltransferase
MNGPWLSVVMPTYNGARYLHQALSSVVAQADPHIELITIDDGSTDDTVAILNSYRDRLPLTILPATPHTRNNWVENTNRGLRHASAPYACFLHQDDVWLPNRLSSVRKSIQAYPEAAMHIQSAWFINEQGEKLGIWKCPLPCHRLLTSSESVDSLLVQNSLAVGVPVFRRDCAEQVGFLDPSVIYPADWDFWLKLARLGPTICSPDRSFAYRLHSQSMTSSSTARLEAVALELHQVLNRHFPDPELSSPKRCPEFHATCEFAIELNIALLALAGRQRPQGIPLMKRALRMSPGEWRRFFRDSAILPRILARIRLLIRLRRREVLASA